MIAVAAALAGAAIALAGALAGAHASPSRSVEIRCPSPSLAGTLPALVTLPAGYDGNSDRYPVIYVLHGLPADTREFTRNGFIGRAVSSGPTPAIVVAPQGSRAENSDREYLDESPTENWPRAIAHDLPRCIDARYRTVRDRTGRVLIGFSAGGYGAANIGLRHLATYGAVESWSGYFEATDPSGLHVLDLGSRSANAAATVPAAPGCAASSPSTRRSSASTSAVTMGAFSPTIAHLMRLCAEHRSRTRSPYIRVDTR